jgi:hypothetical protein
MMDQLLFVSLQRATVVDVVEPDGLGRYSRETLEQIKGKYPDAQVMASADFCRWKEERQRGPIEWAGITEDRYNGALDCLPPARHKGWAFLLGEPIDSMAITGEFTFDAFRRLPGEVYQRSSRTITVAEFDAIFGKGE